MDTITEGSTALVWFDQARQALIKAKSVDEVKELRDKAEALRLYTKQAGESLEMQNYCAEIKVRAERRAGELLSEMDRHKGAATPFQPETSSPLRLEADLHIDRSKVHRWQTIARLPEPDFEAHVAQTKARGKELTSAGLYDLARQTEREAAREAKRQAEYGPVPDDVTLWCGDFLERGEDIPDESVDLILTDPPYGRDFLPRLDDLGSMAARVLKPSGSLLMMYGQLYLLEAMQALHQHLHYQWVFSYRLHGSATAQHASHVHNHWKPLLWYCRDRYEGTYQGDRVDSEDVPDKRFDPWGQSVGGFALLVKRFTEPGQLILDPCLGGGTSAVAAVLLRRRFIGIDIDPGDINITKGRLAEVDTFADDDNLSLDLN